MSDFGMFEADEVAANEPRRQARTAARKLDAAIDNVRANFGRFLLGATGIDEFEDRWHLSKNDIRASVEPMVFPNTGTMRRIQNAMKSDWKLAHPYKLAIDHDDAGFGSMPEGDSHRNQDLDETYSPSSGNLIPEGNFESWKDSVDQDGPEKVSGNDFTPGGDSGSDKHARRRHATDDDNYSSWMSGWADHESDVREREREEAEKDGKKEAARLVADIYTDFARSNGLRVASLDTLDAYAATGIAESDFRLLAGLIVRQAEAECDDDEDTDSEAPEASESDESDSDDDEGDDYDFGGEDAAEDDTDDDGDHDDDDHHDFADTDSDGDHDDDDHHDGGEDDYDFGGDEGGDVSQTFTVPEHAPELDPQMLNEIPHDDTDGSAPVPPEVIDSLLGLPEGTIEQLLLEEVEQGQGGSDGYGAPPQGGGDQFGGAPQGGGDDFLGEGGDDAEQEPPRVARRSNSDYGRPPQGGGIPKRFNDNYYSTDPDQLRREMEDDERTGEMETERERQAARRFWADSRRIALEEGETPSLGPLQGPMDLFSGLPEGLMPQSEDDLDMPMVDKLTQQYHDDPFRKYGPELDPAAGHAGFGEFSRFGPDSFDYDAINRMTDARQEHERGRTSRRRSSRSFWAAEGDEQPAEGGGGEQQAAPAQDPAAAMGGMQQPMMPPPGSGAVAPPAPPQQLENQPAEDALLDTANQAIMQMIDQETAEYQQIIDPLSQALQAIQFAQQVEQSEHPMDVTPPEGTVNVDPSAAPGGAQAMQQQAKRRVAGEWPPPELEHTPHDECPECYEIYGHGPNCPVRLKEQQDKGKWLAGGGPSFSPHPLWSREAKVEFGIRNAAKLIAGRYRLSATGHQMLLNAALGRRGYEHVVEALKLVPAEVRQAAAIHMSHLFAAGNQRFNKDVFMKTVMAGTSKDRRGRLPFDPARLAAGIRQASDPRDREWDAWASGRDRGRAEHGVGDLNQGLDEYHDELNDPHGYGDRRDDQSLADFMYNDYPDRQYNDDYVSENWFENYTSGGPDGRSVRSTEWEADHPQLVSSRLAGETWTNTPTKDAFEFPNAGEVPRVDDNNDTNNLPPMKGADPHGKNAASEKAVDRFQRWQKSQQERGLPTTQGESAVHNFLQTHNPIKKRVGPEASDMIHRELGLNPDSVKTPRAKPVKAVNPTLKGKGGKTPAAPMAKAPAPKAAPKTATWGEWEPTKQASFFTRKVAGWRWDDHLNGYLSKEARAFTCACGEKIAAPSYKTCACGKVWNVYAIGDSHHLASDTADVYIAREIEVRPGVIMANRKMAGFNDTHSIITEHGTAQDAYLNSGHPADKEYLDQVHEELMGRAKAGDPAAIEWSQGGSSFDPDKEQDPFDPRLMGANRKMAADEWASEDEPVIYPGPYGLYSGLPAWNRPKEVNPNSSGFVEHMKQRMKHKQAGEHPDEFYPKVPGYTDPGARRLQQILRDNRGNRPVNAIEGIPADADYFLEHGDPHAAWVLQKEKQHGKPLSQFTEDDWAIAGDPPPRKAHRVTAKDGDCTCWEGYERVPGTEPCASKSCRKKTSARAQATFKQYLAEVERLASGMSHDDIMKHIDEVLAEGEGHSLHHQPGVDLPERVPLSQREYDMQADYNDEYCPDCGGDGCDWDTYPNHEGNAELCGTCDGTGENTPIPRRAQATLKQHLAEIERLADWKKYDSPDPSRDPKAKPPSTTIKSQPGDWTNRDFTGPTKGQWREPDPTELPRKTRKKK